MNSNVLFNLSSSGLVAVEHATLCPGTILAKTTRASCSSSETTACRSFTRSAPAGWEKG